MVIDLTQALLKTCENVYLVITLPGLAIIKLWHSSFQLDFRDEKIPQSRGCAKCVECGGKQKMITPSSMALAIKLGV
jgi:hypothetical protein